MFVITYSPRRRPKIFFSAEKWWQQTPEEADHFDTEEEAEKVAEDYGLYARNAVAVEEIIIIR